MPCDFMKRKFADGIYREAAEPVAVVAGGGGRGQAARRQLLARALCDQLAELPEDMPAEICVNDGDAGGKS